MVEGVRVGRTVGDGEGAFVGVYVGFAAEAKVGHDESVGMLVGPPAGTIEGRWDADGAVVGL